MIEPKVPAISFFFILQVLVYLQISVAIDEIQLASNDSSPLHNSVIRLSVSPSEVRRLRSKSTTPTPLADDYVDYETAPTTTRPTPRPPSTQRTTTTTTSTVQTSPRRRTTTESSNIDCASGLRTLQNMTDLNTKLREHIIELRDSKELYPNVLIDFPVTIDRIFAVIRDVSTQSGVYL